jgi:FKBP-type peptidyl-prolyl cis-trans isomerase SlyD
MSESMQIEDGQVITMNYTLTVEGDVIDTSVGNEPFEFIQGIGNIIPGLEGELYGMTVGDAKKVRVSPEQGYGLVDAEAYSEVPVDSVPANIPLEVGTQLEVHDQAGNPFYARIDQVNEKTVRLDFNHPLAGKELQFDVEILGLRAATAEELEHGHVHSPGHAHSS